MRETVGKQPVKGGLKFLYDNPLGRPLLRLLSARWVSRLAGKYLDSRLSRHKIKPFIKRHGIRMEEYLPERYQSFNAFFTRRIDPARRPFDPSPEALCAPCDGAVTVFPVTAEGTFTVKGFDYTVETLLGDRELAAAFEGGVCVVFRLTVGDYHRYHFFDDGRAGESRFIKGRLHTVRPAALARRRVFTENCRVCTVLHTEGFGDAVMVEVGAMFVGRIVNEEKETFRRGEEKGYFEFGGSTVILLLGKDRAEIDAELLANTAAGLETKVRCGERIGTGHNIL